MDHLKRLFREDQSLLRSAHKLSQNVLNPSKLERQSVHLMLAVTDPSTVAALRHIAEVRDRPDWMDTALFLEFIYTWFTILNVRKPGQDNRYCKIIIFNL